MCNEKFLTILFYFTFLCFLVHATYTFKLENNTSFIRTKRQTNCGFHCKSGECIDEDKECDGKADCKDESDESNSCQRIKCPSYLFRCKYGACINPELECDGKKDCRDSSDETSDRCKRSTTGSCSSTQFQCNSGQCIDEDNKCDGKVDCNDNSDETKQTCSSMRCPGFTYRCDYGACVNGNSKCNGIQECFDGSDEKSNECGGAIPQSSTTSTTSKPIILKGSCILPTHPSHGNWKVWGAQNSFNPGDAVTTSTVLMVECNKRYKLAGSTLIYCNNGAWSESVPECTALCPALSSTTTTTVICKLNDVVVNCSEPVSGTIATFRCAPYYEDLQLKRNPNRICYDGSWDHERPSCVPACGMKSVNAQTLIVGGNKAAKGDYPWQVAIYTQRESSKRFICGGSLLNQRVIITAAHCVTDVKGIKKPKEIYHVAVGKYYRSYEDLRDTEAQFSILKDIFLPIQYRGEIQNFLGDIAILVTETIFNLSKRVQPVCVDWTGSYENHLLEPGVKGIVTGWGYTVQGGEVSEELKELSSPYIDYGQCSQELPPDFEVYLTYDKMCSGYLNQNISVCEGDSGGGLVFKNKEDGRYYIEGIVSVSPRANGSCNVQQYALYTKVSRYVNGFIFEKERLYRP